MDISFPYEYYIIAVNHKGKKSKRVETCFVGINSFTDYPTGWNSYDGAVRFNTTKDALIFFGKYKEHIMTNSDVIETFNPRIIKVTCVEDPIVEGNSERSL